MNVQILVTVNVDPENKSFTEKELHDSVVEIIRVALKDREDAGFYNLTNFPCSTHVESVELFTRTNATSLWRCYECHDEVRLTFDEIATVGTPICNNPDCKNEGEDMTRVDDSKLDEDEVCDECGITYPPEAQTLQGPWHQKSCSLYDGPSDDTPGPDIQFEKCGGIAVAQPLTKKGLEWVQNKLSFEKWQVTGGTGVAVDPCTVDDLRQRAIDDGLIVK